MALSQQALSALEQSVREQNLQKRFKEITDPRGNTGVRTSFLTAQEKKSLQSQAGLKGGQANPASVQQRFKELEQQAIKDKIQSQFKFNPASEIASLASKSVKEAISPAEIQKIAGSQFKLGEALKAVSQELTGTPAGFISTSGGGQRVNLFGNQTTTPEQAIKQLKDIGLYDQLAQSVQSQIQGLEADPSGFGSQQLKQFQTENIGSLFNIEDAANAQQTVDFFSGKQGELNPFERSTLEQAQRTIDVRNLLDQGKTDEALALAQGTFSTRVERSELANQLAAQERAQRQDVSQPTQASRTTRPIVSGEREGEALSIAQDLRGRGLADSIIESRLRRDGFSDAEISNVLSGIPTRDQVAVQQRQNVQSAAISSLPANQQAQISQALQSGDPAQVEFANEQINKAIALGDTSFMDIELSEPLILGVDEFISDAQSILGANAEPVLASINAANKIGIDLANQQAITEIRALREAGEITKKDAQRLVDDLMNIKETSINEANTQLQSLARDEETALARLDSQTDRSISSTLTAKEEALTRTKAQLARLGIINSSDNIRIINDLAKQYDDRLSQIQEDRVFNTLELANQFQNTRDQINFSKQRIEQQFASDFKEIETNLDRQLADIRNQAFSSQLDRNRAIADAQMTSINQVNELTQKKIEAEQEIAKELALKDPLYQASRYLNNGQSINLGGQEAVITGIDGSDVWPYGLDVQYPGGNVDVAAPVLGTVLETGNDPDGFGNWVMLDIGNGYKMRVSHLDSINVGQGDKVGPGTNLSIGVQGNSGKTSDGRGGFQIDGETDPNRGIHVDYTIYDTSGNEVPARSVASIVRGDVNVSRLTEGGRIRDFADDIFENPALLSTLTATERGDILKTLSNRGQDISKFGNPQFVDLKEADYQSLVDLSNLRNRIDQLRELNQKIDIGPIASQTKRAQRLIGQDTTDFDILEINSGRLLADFIKDISGAAVSEQEAERLARLVPNVNMQDTQFDNALNNFEQELENTLAGKIKRFGFNNEEDFFNALGVGNELEQQQFQDNLLQEMNTFDQTNLPTLEEVQFNLSR